MRPLDNVWLKVDRAQEHLDLLYKEIGDFHKLEPYAFVPEEDSKQRGKVFRFEVRQEPPLRWSVIVGDFAFNLRAALDHLAWQLAIIHVKPNKPNIRTEFPIYNSLTTYGNRNAEARREDILPAARHIIEQLQPYNRANWPEVEHLWWLHELNRIDKHQTIIPSFLSSQIKTSNLPGIFRSKPLHNGDRVVVLRIQSGLKLELGVDIGFEFAELPFGGLNFTRLDGIHKFVREEVIPRFTGLF